MEFPKSVEDQLKALKEDMKLNKQQYENLLKLAEKQYAKARVVPGEAVGVIAAQSLGEPGTQLTMRTKWLAGAREMTVTQGLPRLIEIFDAKREPTTPAMEIYLKSSHATSESKAEEIALSIVDVKLEDITSEINVDLAKMRVEVYLDKNKVKHYGVTEKYVQNMVKENFKTAKITTGDMMIGIRPKEEEVDLRKLYGFRVKVKETHITGIEGIKQVLPVKVGDVWMIKTAGSNLREVLAMKEVDIENTKTNDVFETFSVLGIEAARTVIVEEALDVLRNQGIEVDPRHLMLLADAMTNTGSIRGIGRYGISGAKSSVLARASFEVPLRHLFNAAMYGESDEISSVIENVMINQPIPVGTGIVKLKIESEAMGKKKTEEAKEEKAEKKEKKEKKD
ncbi:MAG: DNA-directed RNA polymerase subunit A'' [Candidatus Nanoarchaeia archaeon]|nr:DNA-directed RNA polymerase subunit A'' [Candidatus Paceibacterota bacterium]MDD5238867.1 DNA-directed RNA polymerase subunit A'' [Candidatus Nanoarchaeia archaeon]